MNASLPLVTAPAVQPLAERLVRYADLKPCTTAFVDSRTPGSERKENFTIIGPGVAENPDQHVHISIPHGFNIGGARQPPKCVNSQHSHQTAEVFIIHSGRWRFTTGERGEGASVELGPGDTISIPTQVFRGFENTGDDVGFMFAVLGGDDPGRVLWAPYVFEAAARHGLVLLDDGRLVDTHAGQRVPAGAQPMPMTSAAEVAALKSFTAEQLAGFVHRANKINCTPQHGYARHVGVRETPIIGAGNSRENIGAGTMHWAHGFHVRRIDFQAHSRVASHHRDEVEVLLGYAGELGVDTPDGAVTLGRGDTLSLPAGLERQFHAATDTTAFVVRGGDTPGPARWR